MGPALLPAPLSPAIAIVCNIRFTRFQAIQGKNRSLASVMLIRAPRVRSAPEGTAAS
jgi:hypothetical protein